ncbi:MAG: relaxase MobL [Oscillospiraceae bacterium]|nr:relaxase MobL [Oscillospiraceae bacterium]
MPRVIFKCPHVQGGTPKAAAHLGNAVGYIATRKGAQRIDPGKMDLPATENQVNMVEKLTREFPLSKGLDEYVDYQNSPTRGNASEFITRAVEENLDQIAKMENYVDYIAKRPRAQRFGSHGLFASGNGSLTLSKIQEEVAHHPGTVWLPVISLRREDAARLGFDSAERWKEFLSGYSVEMAQAMKIPLEQFRWYAAFHDESHHPHVHMVCYSADGKSGFLTDRGIERIKSGLAKEIFKNDLTEIYARQTQRRDSLNQDSQKVLRQIIRQMQENTLSNERIEQLMMELSRQLRNTSGKKQYGYLKPSVKSLVDEIVDELERDERIAAAYNLWYEMREEVLRTYKDDLPERIPLSRQKEFKRIKNIVIQEAVRLGAQLEQDHAASTPQAIAAGQKNDEHSSALLANSVTRLLHHMSRIFQEQPPPASPVYHTDRKLLRKLREKKIAHGHKPDDHAPKLS